MKKKLLGLLVPLALAASVATPVASATAAPPPVPIPKLFGTTSCNTPSGKPFTVYAYVVDNKEINTYTIAANGDYVDVYTGQYFVSFQSPYKTIVRNESGPGTSTFDPNTDKVVQQGTGLNFFLFGPASQQNLLYKEPGLVFTSGKVVLAGTIDIATGIQTADSFSLNGTQENGCYLLS
jgi:hypothetical protein